MGKTKNTTAKNSALHNTPTKLPNSRETGHFSEPEKTRTTTTPTPTTPVLTAGMAELISGDVASVLTGTTDTQRPPDTLKSKSPFAMAGNQDALQLTDSLRSKPPSAMAGNQDALQWSGITPVKSTPPFAMAGNKYALQLSGITPVNSEPPFAMAGNKDALQLTDSLKTTHLFAMAGKQDALQVSGPTPVSAVDVQENGGGGDRSAKVSHAAGPLLTHNAHSAGLMGVSTPQRGKQRDDYEGQSKDKYALFGAERVLRQQLELLDQKDLHAAAAHAEAIE